jgi:large subunit ribosomal protein L32
MPHPKRKSSQSRRDKRRTHYKADAPVLNTCPQTGEVKYSHRATVVIEDGQKVYYYNGRKF